MRLLAVPLLVLTLMFVALPAHADFLTDADRARLQGELDSLNAQIAEWQKVIADTQAKKNSLQGDVTALNAQIAKAQAEVNARNVSIKQLSDDIGRKEESIADLDSRLARGKDSLANMLRLKNQADDRSIAEMLLSSTDFSSFFGTLDALAVLTRDLNERFAEIEGVKSATEVEKQTLAAKQDAELDARYAVQQNQKVIASSKAEKDKLLKITSASEAAYQTVLADRQRRANAINAALFPLRDTSGISFGDALNFANAAEAATGVRAALILAILSQESDLGKNVGSCYVTNLATGDGVGKNTGKVITGIMKVPRDTVPFKTITESVGRLWGATPVSCPAPGGYGGAMGPTQFIPSTWVLYESRLKAALGNSGTPDPWDAKTAIMATGLLMKDNGASGGAYTAERNAACKYYSGGSCSKSKTIAGYGDSVINKANAFQADIDFLKGV